MGDDPGRPNDIENGAFLRFNFAVGSGPHAALPPHIRLDFREYTAPLPPHYLHSI